jgi:hypothetical protein
MTDDEKVEIAVKKLTDASMGDAYSARPYPGRWLGDVFVYYNSTPDQDHDGNWGSIDAHRRADLIDWIDRAAENVRSVVEVAPDTDYDLWEALWEVEEPPGIDDKEDAHAQADRA